MSATIFAKTATDKVLILDTRQTLIYPFTCPNWLDLRLGVFLSATKASVDDDTSGLAESGLGSGGSDTVWIGFKNNSNDALPFTAGANFLGIGGDNQLRTGTGAGAGLWYNIFNGWIRNEGSYSDFGTSMILDYPTSAWAPGYARFTVLKLTRSSVGANISMRYESPSSTAAGAYSSAPTIAATRTLMRTRSADNALINASVPAPDALIFHWPFYNSRLRIHTIVLEKYA